MGAMFMEKLHQDIKHMVDQVNIPEDKLHDTVQQALLLAKKKRKSFLVKKQHIVATIAFVLVLTFGVLLLNSYDQSASGDLTNSILFKNGDEGLQRMVSEGKVQDLLLKEKDQGITVMLKEGYLDNHQLAVSFQIETDGNVTLPKETSLEYEWFLNGKTFGEPGWVGISTERLINRGEIFTNTDTSKFPINSNLELRIHKINEVTGNWSFQFQLDKREEYIVLTELPVKHDAFGNQLQVTRAELTPSQLQLSTNVTLLSDELYSDFQEIELSIIGIGADGTRYLPRELGYSNHDTPRIDGKKTDYRKTEIPRGVDVYTYQVVPYIVTYQGEEIPVDHGRAFDYYRSTVPFAEGEILGTESSITVEEIEHSKENTIVSFDMEQYVPELPRVQNRKTEEVFYPISFKQEGNTIQATYPKINQSKDMEFYMYDASYQLFPELETTIEFE